MSQGIYFYQANLHEHLSELWCFQKAYGGHCFPWLHGEVLSYACLRPEIIYKSEWFFRRRAEISKRVEEIRNFILDLWASFPVLFEERSISRVSGAIEIKFIGLQINIATDST